MLDVILEELGLTEKDIVVENYENMTREELIACLNAADAHHQEHHQWQEALKAENEELKSKLSETVIHLAARNSEIAELKAKLEKAKDALQSIEAKIRQKKGFYAISVGHDEIKKAHKAGILKGLDVIHEEVKQAIAANAPEQL